MADEQNYKLNLPDPKTVLETVARIGARSTRLAAQLLRRQLNQEAPDSVDMTSMIKAFATLGVKLTSQPGRILSMQTRLTRDQAALWASFLSSMSGDRPLDVIQPEKGDKRFRDAGWDEIPAFSLIKQAYLLWSRWILETVDEVEGIDEHTRHKLKFYTEQYVAMLAPTNFVLSNPAVLRATLTSGGNNLLQGLDNLLADIERGNGRLNIRMTELNAFSVGRDLANTPGEVVYQNDLMQLIQYTPTTAKVHQRPLLVIPPWINKYYILDLGEKKSFVKYWVDNGFTVFVISWVNPDASLAGKSFEDYMLEGPLAALDAIEKATGEKTVHPIGYCIGGTLLGCTLAYMAAKGDQRVPCATFLNSLLDFSQPGDLAVFIDEDMIQAIEKIMDRRGYLDSSAMATTFNMLRPNDLIWSFVVNNYLLGRQPPSFDLLYWNSDSTRMPKAMHSFYLRNMYQHNRLREPGGITLAGVPIDLRKITIPTYFASTIVDHIAPWISCYIGSQQLSGPVRFVLSGSGHIAGAINPPAQKKYWYLTNEEGPTVSPQEWLDDATRHQYSWWPDWLQWAQQYTGPEVGARKPGDGRLPVIEPAPGSYVHDRPAPPTPPARTRARRQSAPRKKAATTRKPARTRQNSSK